MREALRWRRLLPLGLALLSGCSCCDFMLPIGRVETPFSEERPGREFRHFSAWPAGAVGWTAIESQGEEPYPGPISVHYSCPEGREEPAMLLYDEVLEPPFVAFVSVVVGSPSPGAGAGLAIASRGIGEVTVARITVGEGLVVERVVEGRTIEVGRAECEIAAETCYVIVFSPSGRSAVVRLFDPEAGDELVAKVTLDTRATEPGRVGLWVGEAGEAWFPYLGILPLEPGYMGRVGAGGRAPDESL